MAKELAPYLRGWIGYFGKCETPSVLQSLEEWIRRRLRSAIWKQWKRGTVRFAELRKRGVGTDLAAQTAGSAHGPWRLANSPALAHRAAQCLLRLARDSEIDGPLIAQPAEPPYADPHVRWCDRESGRPLTYVDYLTSPTDLGYTINMMYRGQVGCWLPARVGESAGQRRGRRTNCTEWHYDLMSPC